MATYLNINSTAAPSKTTFFKCNGRKAFVLSDLHLAAGLNKNGNYDGTENFFYDQSFVRFLDYLQTRLDHAGGLLIFNGDFIDFSRITRYPQSDTEILQWQEIIEKAGIKNPPPYLYASISKKEKKYGLKTHEYKSVWKLHACMQGHKALFKRLARWVKDGNEIIIVKGNHDLEWYWPAVQQYLRVTLPVMAPIEEQAASAVRMKALKDVLPAAAAPLPTAPAIRLSSTSTRIHFADQTLLLDNKIHIEHGHRFERTTAVTGEQTIRNEQELNYPFGSFINRYLINGLELCYPFLDNVRPTQNILKVLFKENFPKALGVVGTDLPVTLGMIPKKYTRQILSYLIPFMLVIVLPIVVMAIAAYTMYKKGQFDGGALGTWAVIGNVFKCGLFLLLSYVMGKILAYVGFGKKTKFADEAKKIMQENSDIEAVIFGHTHDPEQVNMAELSDGQGKRKNQWYFNTGTWIPVFETSSANVRFDKTYTFIAINPEEDPPCRERLQRWNDDAERVDTMIINDKM